MRLWERAFRRAGIPLAYSEGFNPHPRLSLAAPLPVGVTSEAELMDIFISRPVSPHWFVTSVSRQLPAGAEILEAHQTAPTMPSLQSQVRYAEYMVKLDSDHDPAAVQSAVADLLAAERLPWRHYRDTGERNYDLRALIDNIELVEQHPPGYVIRMKLRCDSGGSGRPEQVALALGFAGYPESIHRARLILQPPGEAGNGPVKPYPPQRIRR
ncbi:MAG: TIGR03936 family radical SAM-associated protein [Dehalococcoidales bacterium]|nr:TIGR03936 family radical SAM-associated protein [Dehalococcoidales bacterium]